VLGAFVCCNGVLDRRRLQSAETECPNCPQQLLVSTDDQLKKQLAERPTTYLLGQVDVLPLGGFDSSPSGMAQGPTRRARGEAFFNYITETLGAKHNAIIVPECGHNDRCIFTSDVVLPVIFPQ